MTLREAATWGARELEFVPELHESAAQDAALLLRFVTGYTPAQMLAWPERALGSAEEQMYRAVIGRRRMCEPVQYITGEQEFYGLDLQVTPAVLIPRPETEVLVETVVRELRADHSTRAGVQILDVGTGSGAIALALAREFPNAQVTAVDLSAAALQVAGENAFRLGLSGRVRFVESNLMQALAPEERFHAIVSNPPYVPSGDREGMHPQVREYEPAQALFAGQTGLDVYRRLIPAAQKRLHTEGLLAMEIGFGQRTSLEGLLAEWRAVGFVDDLRGIARVVTARRPAV